MWKPGTEKPKPNKGKEDLDVVRNNKRRSTPKDNIDHLAQNKSPPSVKKLSNGTMNMRFMQRTANAAIDPQRVQAQSSSSSSSSRIIEPTATMQKDIDMTVRRKDDDGNDLDDDNDDDVDVEEGEPSRYVAATTAEDMYGTILMGRRSFGGYRPIIEQMVQQGEASMQQQDHPDGNNGKKTDRKRKRNKKK